MTPSWFNTPERVARLQFVAGTCSRTPFFANSEAPGPDGGMDCVHLLNYIYRECGTIGRVEIPRQVMDHGQHSERSLLIEAFETWPELRARFACVWRRTNPAAAGGGGPDEIHPGDALCFFAGKVPHHGALKLAGQYIFHTLAGVGAHRMQLTAAVRGWRILGALAAVYRPLP